MRIAFQGEIGAFSEEATRALFPDGEPVPFPSFDAVFEAVAAGAVERAVVPIENTLFGSVHANFDLLRAHDLVVIGELKLRIVHHLMALPGETLETIREVRSHPQALGQSQVWLREHVPQAAIVPVYDTAGAAKMVAAEQARGVAAVASARAAAEYRLAVLAAGIETDHRNYTRFLVLARPEDAPPVPTGDDTKTSVVFSLRSNVPGALFKALAVFALRDIDLSKIESRPLVGSPWEFYFFLDVRGSTTEEPVRRAIDHLAEIASEVRVLGSYREGAIVG